MGRARKQRAARKQAPAASRLETWAAAHRRWILAVVVAVSLAVRIVYFVELSDGPCVEFHRWEQLDMHWFDTWARHVASSGDWLSEKIDQPFHSWHKTIADAYFRRNPEEAKVLAQEAAAGGGGASAARLLWRRWHGGRRFYQEPLYPYLIAATYELLGADVRWVFAWQMLLGVATSVLVLLTARLYFGEAAGGLAALASPLLYYEMLLLRETSIVFAQAALVYGIGTLSSELRGAAGSSSASASGSRSSSSRSSARSSSVSSARSHTPTGMVPLRSFRGRSR